MELYIVAYQGNSGMSKMIEKINRGAYSHVSFLFSDGYEFEAWHVSDRTKWYRPFAGCFQKVKFGANHTKGTPVVIFKVKGLKQENIKNIRKLVEYWAIERRPYDYIGCTRFITKINKGNAKKLFCSESILEAFSTFKVYILKRIMSYLAHPTMITYSPIISIVKTGNIGDNFDILFE